MYTFIERFNEILQFENRVAENVWISIFNKANDSSLIAIRSQLHFHPNRNGSWILFTNIINALAQGWSQFVTWFPRSSVWFLALQLFFNICTEARNLLIALSQTDFIENFVQGVKKSLVSVRCKKKENWSWDSRSREFYCNFFLYRSSSIPLHPVQRCDFFS